MLPVTDRCTLERVKSENGKLANLKVTKCPC